MRAKNEDVSDLAKLCTKLIEKLDSKENFVKFMK